LTPSASQSFDFLSITIPHATSFPPNQEPHPKSNYAPPYFLTPLPIFHVLIKILNCYLHDILQQRLGEDEQKATVGIAISSFSDARIMYFCVHLSIGASLTISSWFVQIIEQNEERIDISEEERENTLIDS
jgi:hypothetical protein